MTFTEELIATQQDRLQRLGYYTGKADGVEGPLTRAAMSLFKADNGMVERPYPGPQTMAALWSPTVKPRVLGSGPGQPVWITEANRFIGVKETPGVADNPVIMGWAKQMGQWYTGDDVPWCGLYVAHCMSVGAPLVPQDFNRLGARNWLEYGVRCDAGFGAIAVFWRTHKTKSWHGHAGFIVGGSGGHLHILGGNQGDMVSVIAMPRDQLLGCVAPPGFIPALPLKPSPLVGMAGKLS